MKKNIERLPSLKVFIDGRYMFIAKIKDVPIYSPKFLIESTTLVGNRLKQNPYTQDLSYEIHMWYLLYISCLYQENQEFTLRNIKTLNERFVAIKNYFHYQIVERDLKVLPNDTFAYLDADSDGLPSWIPLTKQVYQRIKAKYDQHTGKVKSMLDANKYPGLAEQLAKFRSAFCKQVDCLTPSLGSEIEGVSIEDSVLSKHRYWYALNDFMRLFVRGEFP